MATLSDVVEATIIAAGPDSCIDVLINGNRPLATGLAAALAKCRPEPDPGITVNVWHLEQGDKAQTLNVIFHTLRRNAQLFYFLDGYARPNHDAFAVLERALNGNSGALAATGVPSVGRSARQQGVAMQTSGGLHGNLFVLSRQAMDEIRQREFRLPMGLYRVDSLLGAVLNFNFDPARHPWTPSRIVVAPEASWSFTPLSIWKLRDLQTHLKRVWRQTTGALENMAVKDHLVRQRQPAEHLPTTACELVLNWWHGGHGPSLLQRLRNPAWNLAIRKFQESRDWSNATKSPLRLYGNDNLVTATPEHERFTDHSPTSSLDIPS
ncbi:MAG TPA: hypothetical protein VK165_05155 [Azonexus sp.]|nr:hypothetical protein [Azonexus sp.]